VPSTHRCHRPKKTDAIARKEGLFKNPAGTLSFNINPYIDSWIRTGDDVRLGRTAFVKTIAETLDALIGKLGVNIMYLTTQMMDYDIVHETLALVRQRNRITLVGLADYDYVELTGLLSRCGLHVGMRTHSKILAAAAHTPMVTINAYPKSVGFVRTIGMGDWVVNLDDLTSEKLVAVISSAWEKRKALQSAMIPIVEKEQAKARLAADIISPYFTKEGGLGSMTQEQQLATVAGREHG
jgi:colanic acid/amylovoran biosynthesis protein